MTRIAFVADLHADDLGTRVNPATGLNARFEDALAILAGVARDAQDERGADVLVVGGDFTENRHPAPWRVALVAQAIRAFGGPTVLVRGNHDGLRAGASIVDVLAQMLDDAAGFSRPGWFDARDGTVVCAVPYLDRSWIRATSPELTGAPDADVYRALEASFLAVARGLYAEARQLAGTRRVVLVVHQALAGGQMSDQQAAFLGGLSLVVDTAALAAIGFDAILAGHFHMHQVLATDPLVVYAGSPHRVTFAEENQPKGYVVVDTDRLPDLEFVETPARRFRTLRWPDSPGVDVAVLADEAAGVRDAIVRVLDVPPGEDVDSIRRRLEGLGAFEVGELRARPAEVAAPRGLGEALAPADALAAYLEDDPDRAGLMQLGREILEEASL